MPQKSGPGHAPLAINEENEATFSLEQTGFGLTLDKLVGFMESACEPMLARAIGHGERGWCASLEIIRTGGNLAGESLRVRARYIGLHGDLLVFEVNAETNGGGMARGLLMNQVERGPK